MGQRILVAGGVSWDTVVGLDALPQPRPGNVHASSAFDCVGSTGAGKALNLAKLGHDVTLYALLGEDEFGARARAELAVPGLRFVAVADSAGTERHINLTDRLGRRMSIYATHATFAPPVDAEQVHALVDGCDILALNIINHCRAFIAPARALGRPIWCDVHDWDGAEVYHAEFVAAATHLFASGERLADPRRFVETQLAAGKEVVVCTLGREGAIGGAADGSLYQVAIADDLPVVDTNGAGDAFFAGFLHAHTRGAPLLTCLHMGTLAAGLCVGVRGLAAPSLDAVSLEALWARRSSA